MIVLGLLLLVVAAVIVLVGVLSNLGSSHLLTHSLNLFGYHLSGSTGRLLLVGVILGGAGMLGLNLLLAGLGRGIKHRASTRRQLKADRQDNKRLAGERDRLGQQLQDERAAPGAEATGGQDHPTRAGSPDGGPSSRRRR